MWEQVASLGYNRAMPPSPNFYDQVYAVIRRIPPGKVTSYGRIAAMLGRDRAARAVGYALNALKGRRHDSAVADIPWHRVLNSKGCISLKNRSQGAQYQAELLRQEGVEVSNKLCVDLDRYLWEGLHVLELDDIMAGRHSE